MDGYKADICSKNGYIKYVPLNDLKFVQAEPTDAEIAPKQVWEVEEILDYQSIKGKYCYLVKRPTTKDPTWEPQANLRLIDKSHEHCRESILG